jgi:hypothetical protein|tara:strand:+ start:319 stop:636 length:318 start_codon:yes stop_codon:yes gene_type:complete
MYKKITLIIFLSIFTYSCSTLKEAGRTLRNEKNLSTDEFLVKKNEPLTVPRNIDILPRPNSNKISKTKEQNPLKKILNASEKTESTTKSTLNIEDSILNAIKNKR